MMDNWSEFISKAFGVWAYAHGVKLDFTPPGKVENAVIESSEQQHQIKV